MSEPIYFSKVEFVEYRGTPDLVCDKIVFLNVPERELSYQVLEYKYPSPAIVRVKSVNVAGHQFTDTLGKGAKYIRNPYTNNENVLICDDMEPEVLFSYGMKIPQKRMSELLSYCNALDFEPYRGRKPELSDEGVIGYRDEVGMRFRGITNSNIPLLELSMNYYYDEKHIWPTEKLYRYIVKTYFENNTDLKDQGPHYGGLSLFY